MNKTIYDLDIHDFMYTKENDKVTRVHGGWIYEFCRHQVNTVNHVFVPER